MSGPAAITEARIGTKDRECVDVCPVQSIYEFDFTNNVLVSEVDAGDGQIANTHTPGAIAIFGDSLPYVDLDGCTSWYQPDVCPVGAIYPDDEVPDRTPTRNGNAVVRRECGDVVVVHDCPAP